MKLRARLEENNIDIDFLTRLHKLHESWLIDGQFPSKPFENDCEEVVYSPPPRIRTPVLVLNSLDGVKEMEKVLEAHRNQILNGLM